jgi:hypothetical protein
MNKSIGDAETLRRVAKEWGEFPITTAERAVEFLALLQTRTRGWVIVDFLDTTNWDRFDSFCYQEKTKLLHINWHDFIEQDKKPWTQDREMMSMLFPASLYGLIVRFQSIDVIDTKKFSLFALRGYSLTDKEIHTALKPGSEEYALKDDRPFSKRIIRKIQGHWEVVDCLNAALYTVLIVPKKMHFRTTASKLLLYYKNFELIDGTLGRCERDLSAIDAADSEAICEKANTVRRSMETLLKIECCYREITLEKDYTKARMGDLWGALKQYHSEQIASLMAKFIEWVNKLSHDTGTPIEKAKAEFTLSVVRVYLSLFRNEVHSNFRNPRLRRDKEDGIAF